MALRHIGSVGRVLVTVVGLATTLAAMTDQAEARHHRGIARSHSAHATAHHARRGSLVDSPQFSALVVDANSGSTLYAVNENELRHPASITKVMTLYLLFEKLDAGDLRLDSRLGVSRHAASMAPTKLGLRPGSTIAVEDAIKAIVTKSANDMAVAVAEAIGGDEASFAGLMTRKAHALGMSRTVYVNASGLPDDRQLTTARDLAVLGRTIKEKFPSYYHYFSIPGFTYAGSFMPNHNHLMSRTEGMDGIKTGYTRASGFNLLSSVNRGGHRIISVVLGGKSAASRDNIMARLIDEHIEEAAPTRTAAAPPSPIEEPARTVQVARDEGDEGLDEQPAKERGPNLIAPTLAVPPAPVQPPRDRARTVSQSASRTSIEMPVERPRPAFIAGAPRIDPLRLPPPLAASDKRRLALDGSTSDRPVQSTSTGTALATATPSTLRWIAGPAGSKATPPVATRSAAKAETAGKADKAGGRSGRNEEAEDDTKARAGGSAPRGTWVIQIGATDAADKATDLLNRAKSESRATLASARPFTEKVRKGDSTLYRARFAGLDTGGAEAACKVLKRSGFACFATKD